MGSRPLEHAFGRASIRRRDVNTLKTMIGSFPADVWNSSIHKSKEIARDADRALCRL
jgi:hypothetical protein